MLSCGNVSHQVQRAMITEPGVAQVLRTIALIWSTDTLGFQQSFGDSLRKEAHDNASIAINLAAPQQAAGPLAYT